MRTAACVAACCFASAVVGTTSLAAASLAAVATVSVRTEGGALVTWVSTVVRRWVNGGWMRCDTSVDTITVTTIASSLRVSTL